MIRQRRHGSRWAGLALGMALATTGATAQGATLDWSTNPWPSPATLTQTYPIGGGDVTVTFIDPNGALVGTGGGSPASPSTNNFLNTPLNGGDQNLFVRADGNSGPDWVTIRVEFSHVSGVTDVNFNIYDIDADLSQWRDVIVVSGLALGGGVVAPTSVSPATASPSWRYNPANRRIRGLEPNQGNGNDNGTALVSFMDAIQGFQLSYRNPVTPAGNQWIALSDIAFRIIPEPGPAPLLAVGALTLWLARRRRA